MISASGTWRIQDRKNHPYSIIEYEKRSPASKLLNTMASDDTELQKRSFHNAIAPVIFVAQFFGVMPLWGLRQRSAINNLKFKFATPQMVFAMCILFSDATIMVLYVKYFQKFGLKVGNLVTMVFFSVSFTSYLSFVRLAKRWPKIIRKWFKFEMRFLRQPYYLQNDDKKLARQIRWTAFVITILGIAEHMMFQASSMYNYTSRIRICNIHTDDMIKHYYTTDKSFVFDFLPYHVSIGVMTHICSLVSTVIWNYMDMFIILVSIGLNFRFQQINREIERTVARRDYRKKRAYEIIRMDFVHLCDLLRYIDGQLSFIILLSCFNNLYFICYQLLNIFKTLRYFIDYAYFWYSTLYLLGRTVCLFLIAASINESAKRPDLLLRNIEIKSDEIDRFLYQVNNEVTALSGFGFFDFTRKLLLSMIGMIVTFELVMIQFQWSANQNDELPPLCQ